MRKHSRQRASTGLLLVLVLACAAPAGPPGGEAARRPAEAAAPAATAVPEREAVRFPYSAVSISAVPHWITYDAGLYEREGLDVAMEYIATSTVLGPALLNGEIGLAYTGPEFVMA